MRRVGAMQEEDRLRRQCDERCAKVISEGRCVQKAAPQMPPPTLSDSRTALEASCNGSPTLQRQTSNSQTTVGDTSAASRSVSDVNLNEYAYSHHFIFSPTPCLLPILQLCFLLRNRSIF